MAEVDDAGDLQAEVERLRAANAALEKRARRRRSFRGASSAFLLVLGCGLAALSVVAIWLKVTLLDTDRYVATVAPIAAQPAVQRTVANKINAAIDAKLDTQGLIKQALPDRADILAPALASGFQSVVHSKVNEFTHSPKFQQIWTDANRRAHDRIVALLTGGRSKNLLLQGDTVYLDMSGVVDQVRNGLRARGLDRLASAIPASVNGQIPLVQSDAITKAQGVIRLLKALAILMPLLALLCLVGSILLARKWQYGLLRAALGVAVAMLLLIAALGVARSAYLGAISQDVMPRDAASAIFDTTATFLRHGVRIVVVAAVVIALIAFILGQPLRRWSRAALTHVARGPWVEWTARNERRLMLAVAGVGGFVLLVWSPLNAVVVLIDLLAVAALVGLIAAISSQAAVGTPDPLDHGAVGA